MGKNFAIVFVVRLTGGAGTAAALTEHSMHK